MEEPAAPVEAVETEEEVTPKSVPGADLLVEVLMNERDQAMVDLASWRVALTALLGELILHEMPIQKLAGYVDKVQSDMQHELQFGSPLRHAGALAAAADLVGKIEHAAEWRRAAWENEKKKRSGIVAEPPSGARKKGKAP